MLGQTSTQEFVYSYPFSSHCESGDGRTQLRLATAVSPKVEPYFFEGTLIKPRIAASLLHAVGKMAGTRFYMPANMLETLISLSDPVITCSGDMLRFESFSACASAYMRLDMPPGAYAGEFFGKGTTNVDFNEPLRDALVGFVTHGTFGISVGSANIAMTVSDDEFIEHKVQLPSRWIRSFAEVAAYQSQVGQSIEVGKVAALRFLQSLPGTNNDKSQFYLIPRGGELALTQQPSDGSVKVAGLARLKALRSIAPFINKMTINGLANGEGTSWLIDAEPYRLEFVLSASPWRGFSGEGHSLFEMSKQVSESSLHAVRAGLNWQSKIEQSDLAKQLSLEPQLVESCLRQLGTSGLVGFDSLTSCYFHRELPFIQSRIESANPRLRGAIKIIENGSIEITLQEDNVVEAEVEGSGVKHFVKLFNGRATCTCTWHAKHQSNRGDCKHVLSLRIALEDEDGN